MVRDVSNLLNIRVTLPETNIFALKTVETPSSESPNFQRSSFSGAKIVSFREGMIQLITFFDSQLFLIIFTTKGQVTS